MCFALRRGFHIATQPKSTVRVFFQRFVQIRISQALLESPLGFWLSLLLRYFSLIYPVWTGDKVSVESFKNNGDQCALRNIQHS